MPESVNINTSISLPAYTFRTDARLVIRFLRTLFLTAKGIDKVARTLFKAVLENPTVKLTPDEESRKLATDFLSGVTPGPLDVFAIYWPLQLEILFCRSVDNFLGYITELLTLIFATRPELLTSSKETVTVKTIMQCESREELIAAITEERILSLSFRGLTELSEQLITKYDFRLFENPEELNRAAILVEKRNLFTHNRGTINRRYLARVKDCTDTLGRKLTLNAADVIADINFLISSVLTIDTRAEDKFTIPRDAATPLFTDEDDEALNTLLSSQGSD